MVHFQLVIDCADPDRMSRFWAEALRYVIEPPPEGFGSWDDYYRDLGLPDEDLGIGEDSIVDPDGGGPRFWFQQVPERKTIKNRLHIDVGVSGGRSIPLETRVQRIEAEADRLVALGATIRLKPPVDPSFDHYAIAMLDPEGNEFDIN
jgi:hypothetical protein